MMPVRRHHAMMAYGGVVVKLQVFLTCALDGGVSRNRCY